VMQTAYDRKGEKLFALWFEGRGKEGFEGEEAQIVFESEYESLTAFDPINGVEQELAVCVKDGKTAVEGFLIKDYPVFICAK